MFEVPEVPESKIEPPKDFPFPFPPYSIQKDFMKSLFNALEERKLGIFESPTGTGKSLSLLCGSLTWLEQHESQRAIDLRHFIENMDMTAEEKEVASSSNWITAQHEFRKKKEQVRKATRELAFLEDIVEKRRKIIQNRNKKRISDRSLSTIRKFNHAKSDSVTDTEIDAKSKDDGVNFDDITFDDFALSNYSDSDLSDNEDAEQPEFYQNKIIFASRTHSQLSQFAKELKRTSFSNTITATTLGSRQNLCINPEVTKLKNLSLINERCLDLQKGSKGKKSSENKKIKSCQSCPYFRQHAIEDLKNHILSEPLAIEDLVTAATNEFKACPYYASRKAAKEAQLILLPYNTILHAGTRDGVGIQTEKSVLLLDEAHNITESISNMYSNEINLSQLKDVMGGLELYIKRYMSRFSPKNLLKIKQIKFILRALVQYLEKRKDSVGQQEMDETNTKKNLFTIHEFKVELKIDNLDLFDLVQFMQKYRLIFKLKGYMQQQQKLAIKMTTTAEVPENKKGAIVNSVKIQNKNRPNSISKGVVESTKETLSSPTTWSSQSVLNFAEFLKSLKTCDSEGRIIMEKNQFSFKFLLLNVAPQFQDLVLTTRSIILAGGTMKPYDEITDQLFANSQSRITSFSCDHVIPHDNLVCLTLTKGPSGHPFDFTFKNRTTPQLINELSQTILNIIRIVPGGVVCFLPSYDYEDIFYKFLQESGAFSRIDSKKKIFREPKGGNCEKVLEEYTRQIRNNANGALLFAVVGGKLSEGINFSDDLGRCVIVVGLPYPNITSVEIQEKVQYASATFGKEKGDTLLTNMCSKAVNQSVGRAIRHANDYAAILLVDIRFGRLTQQALLPNWIRERSQVCQNFGQAVGSVSKFFSKKKALQSNTV